MNFNIVSMYLITKCFDKQVNPLDAHNIVFIKIISRNAHMPLLFLKIEFNPTTTLNISCLIWIVLPFINILLIVMNQHTLQHFTIFIIKL